MGKFIWLAVLMYFPLFVIAQVVPDVVSNQDFMAELLKSLGGMSGLSTLGVVAVAVQLIIKFMKTPFFGESFKKLDGSEKLLLITGLTNVGGVISLMSVNGLSWGAALVHSTTLTAAMVFAHQLWMHFTEDSMKPIPPQIKPSVPK